MGPPGCGKTTVAKHISKKFEIPHISSGMIARKLADEDPTTALALKAGSMAPEDSMRALIKRSLEKSMADSGGFVVEGFPRTIAQYIVLRMWGLMPVYIWLDLGDADCLERLILRARDDDTPDAIAKRLRTYQDETLPILALLEESNRVEKINASYEPDFVQSMIETSLEPHVT